MLKIIKLNPYTLNLFNFTLNELNLSVLVEVMCVNISIITHFIKIKTAKCHYVFCMQNIDFTTSRIFIFFFLLFLKFNPALQLLIFLSYRHFPIHLQFTYSK